MLSELTALTISSSTVIQRLLASQATISAGIVVVYFYFDFRDVEKQTVAEMLRSLIFQLSEKGASAPEEVCLLYEKYRGKKSNPTVAELLSLLANIVRTNFSKAYIVLDALDECTERHILLPTLTELMATSSVSLFMSSRGEHDIVKVFSRLGIHAVDIEEARVAADVEIFVSGQLGDIQLLRELSTELKTDIKNALVQGAKGM